MKNVEVFENGCNANLLQLTTMLLVMVCVFVSLKLHAISFCTACNENV